MASTMATDTTTTTLDTTTTDTTAMEMEVMDTIPTTTAMVTDTIPSTIMAMEDTTVGDISGTIQVPSQISWAPFLPPALEHRFLQVH